MRVPSYYPILALRFVEGLSAGDCFALPYEGEEALDRLRSPSGRAELAAFLGKPVGEVAWNALDRQVAEIERHGVGVVTFHDARYPRYLFDIAKPPPVLFHRGNIALLGERGAAVVGTRHPSVRGAAFARSLASDLAELGLTVASGAAFGIDAAAHEGALARRGATVAVVGTGLDVPYPRRNLALLDAIAKTGCVLSEQLMGTPPQAHVFPLRNRLISAVSRIVVVVEAGERSGALLTVQWALEQGREVGAVPAFPGDARGRGVNHLLKSGAALIENVQDVLGAVPLWTARAAASAAPAGRSAARRDFGPRDLRTVLDALGAGPAHPDAMATHLGMSVEAVQAALMELEVRGMVSRDATGCYVPVD